MSRSNRLLIIDDDPDIGELIVQVAENLGFRAMFIQQSIQILDAFKSFDPELVVLDLMMPDADGVQILRSLAKENCQASIILLSGADARVLNSAARLGESHGLRVAELLHKPIAIDDLEAALRRFAGPPLADLKDELREAIFAGNIAVHFQPKVNLGATGEWDVKGVEALARWHHPVQGTISPDVFIPLAEQTGSIDGLTDLVVETAIRQICTLRKMGALVDVAINLSPLLFNDHEAPDRLAGILAQYGIMHSQVIVEITESAAMADDALAMENLTRFRLKGMKLSMDDFGTGYSSLVQLYRMPFSELKVDRSFVMELDRSAEARAIVRSIVDLGHNLNLTVCAEGVETPETLEFLRSIRCDQAQGYLISKPLGEADLIQFFEENMLNQTVATAAV